MKEFANSIGWKIGSLSRDALAECMSLMLHRQSVRVSGLAREPDSGLFSKKFLKIFNKTQQYDHCRAENAHKENDHENVHQEQNDRHGKIVSLSRIANLQTIENRKVLDSRR